MENLVKNRSEIIFCYDIKDANPNGDPLDSNKPRVDEETGMSLVTDVRLKRTIRDYLFDYKEHNGENGKDIFVREIVYDEKSGYVQTGKKRGEEFLELEKSKYKKASEMAKAIAPKILEKCIDVRLFGAVIPVEKSKSDKSSVTFTGAVQFQMGRSMHKISPVYIKGTGAFASGDGKQQATFREEYVLAYSFINFYGIINENSAKKTNLTNDDTKLLIEGMWEGTKNLISRSKFGQMPRLLIKVNYNANGFYIGDINKAIKIDSKKSGKSDEEIRGVEDFSIDVTELKRLLDKYNDKIESVEFKVDDRMKFVDNDKEIELSDLLTGKMTKIDY